MEADFYYIVPRWREGPLVGERFGAEGWQAFERMHRVLDAVWQGSVPLRQFSWTQNTALLKRARVYVGPDTSVSHLAAATGVPCVLLFGPTDPAMWAPPEPAVRVLRQGATLDAIAVSDVLNAIRTFRPDVLR